MRRLIAGCVAAVLALTVSGCLERSGRIEAPISPSATGPAPVLLPGSEIVNSPSPLDFDLKGYVRQAGGRTNESRATARSRWAVSVGSANRCRPRSSSQAANASRGSARISAHEANSLSTA